MQNIEIIKQAYELIKQNNGLHKDTLLLNISLFEEITGADYQKLDYRLKAIRQDYTKILVVMNCIDKTYALYKSDRYTPSYVNMQNQALAELGCFIEYLFLKYRVILEYIYDVLQICIVPRLDIEAAEEYRALKYHQKKYDYLLKYISQHYLSESEELDIEWFQKIRKARNFIVHGGATCLVFGDKNNLLFKVMTVDAMDKEDEEIPDRFYSTDKGLICYTRCWGLYISELILFFDKIVNCLKRISQLSETGEILKEQGLMEKTKFSEADGTQCPDVETVLVDMLESLLHELDGEQCGMPLPTIQRNEGYDAYLLVSKLFPIYRSITGNGVRKSFGIIKDHIGDSSFKVIEIPSGTKVFDWTIPKEWEIEDAFIEDESGKRIISFSDNSLHVVGYSQPIDLWVEYSDLGKYIYTERKQPEAIPYVTSYYKESSGFCMSYEQFSKLRPGKYHLYIKSSFSTGSLSLAEVVFHGESEDEILISTYCCHPSMANDNCSGLALSAELCQYVKSMRHRRYTYRFIFVPETIGAIAYLAYKDNLEHLKKHVKAGYTFSCVGDDGDYSIIFSKTENSLSDRALLNVMTYSTIDKRKIKKYSFLERGSDERQFNSPNVDLGVTGFCRTKYWEFPEYHTSLDTMDIISPEGLQGSFDCMKQVINVLEYNDIYNVPFPCEPQLGKRNLYPNISQKGQYENVQALMNLLAYADGSHDLIEISNKINQPIGELIPIIEQLISEGLLQRGETL